jgi:glutamate 5-kinase
MYHETAAVSLSTLVTSGTSSLCDEKTKEPKIANMSLIVEMAVKLRRDGHRVIIVSSGGIAVGLRRLRMNKRPKHLAGVQAVSAIGQARLIGQWDQMFRQLDQPIAQILLTRNDIADRTQYLNACNTLNELVNTGVIPIINENDTLSVSEIRFGDNDTLSALTAGMINADYLFLMTDVDCLYTDNPRKNPDAKPILVVDDVGELRQQVDTSSEGSDVGTGGMTTKLIAAELATSAGVTTVICRSTVPDNVYKIVNYASSHDTPELKAVEDLVSDSVQKRELESLVQEDVPLHTRFLPRSHPIKDRAFWLLHGLRPVGSLFIDKGAYAAITRTNRAGLLPVGVVAVEGSFHESECVNIYVAQRGADASLDLTKEPVLIGRAIVNYASHEIDRIRGKQSSDIEPELGFADSEYVAFRDNLAFFKRVDEPKGNIPI